MQKQNTVTFIKTTEQDSHYNAIEHMSISEITTHINTEDKRVANAIQEALSQIDIVISKTVKQLKNQGRLFYIGAGTSGRLGILDASECPPTFGVSPDTVIGIIAGGDNAIRNAVENAEDAKHKGWKDLQYYNITSNDIVLGIAASGTTPYVVNALKQCNANNIPTACITCNKNSPLAQVANYPIEVVVGPEFITGSSRMKAGTAQKMVLNMISTATMVKLNRVKGNKMVDMQLSNKKLVQRAITILCDTLKVSKMDANALLQQHKSVRASINAYKKNNN